MNIEIFVEWHRRQGLRIIKSPSSYWYGQKTRVYNALPVHQLIQPTDDELHDLHVHEGALFLRYSKPLHRKEGKISYHVVYEGAPYDPQRLSSKMRWKIRQAAKHCTVEPISLERLADEGWILQQDSMDRQGRLGSMSQKQWQQICRAAHDLPGFEAWACLVEGELASTLLSAQVGDTCYITYHNGHRNFFRLHSNNLLMYEYSQEMLSRPGITRLFSGVHSLDAPPSLDEFKFSMGYRPCAVRQRIKIHPCLTTAFNHWTYTLIHNLHQRYPHQHFLSKADGIVWFYLEGKRPPQQQEWPEHLLPQREMLLAMLGNPNPAVTLQL